VPGFLASRDGGALLVGAVGAVGGGHFGSQAPLRLLGRGGQLDDASPDVIGGPGADVVPRLELQCGQRLAVVRCFLDSGLTAPIVATASDRRIGPVPGSLGRLSCDGTAVVPADCGAAGGLD
jgi:hypothetical protein